MQHNHACLRLVSCVPTTIPAFQSIVMDLWCYRNLRDIMDVMFYLSMLYRGTVEVKRQVPAPLRSESRVNLKTTVKMITT